MRIGVSLLRSARTRLRDGADDLPCVTLSCGVAFGVDAGGGRDGLYRAADMALYTTKNNGRDGISFFGSSRVDRDRDQAASIDQTKE